MTKVTVRNSNGDKTQALDRALRNFKQKVVKNGLLKEAKEREHYNKPGVKKRMAKKEAIKNSHKRDRNSN